MANSSGKLIESRGSPWLDVLVSCGPEHTTTYILYDETQELSLSRALRCNALACVSDVDLLTLVRQQLVR